MHLTVKAAGALLPAPLAGELSAALQAPVLARLLAGVEPVVTALESGAMGTAEDRWLAREIFAVDSYAPTAPYAWSALNGRTDGEATLWHADPIHVAVGRDRLLIEMFDAPPREEEAAALVAAANEVLVAADCSLHRSGAGWFLQSARLRCWDAAPLEAVHGSLLPVAALDDEPALQWSRLHNALQMRWHDDPVNRAREQEGRPAINALWLHGGGAWKPLPRLRWSAVHSDRPTLQGAAAAAGARSAPALSAATEDTLFEWDDARLDHAPFEPRHWLAAMQAIDLRLSTLPGDATIELVLIGRRCTRSFTTRPATGWRDWRRWLQQQSPAATLAVALAEGSAA
jgi:hypothetical protein